MLFSAMLHITIKICLFLQTEINLLSLEPALLCGRTIFVNPKNNAKPADMGISYENIDCLKRKYNILIIHGNIEVCIFIKSSFEMQGKTIFIFRII